MKRGNIFSVLRWYVFGTLTAVILFALFWCSGIEPSDSTKNASDLVISPPIIPDSLSFCNEKVPLEYYDIKESLERELLVNTYWHSQTILFIQRSNRYFSVIEPILKENNIPDDFKYLPLVESGFANVVSPAGAVGFWQIMEGTAKDYGLEVNSEVDERYHLEKATEVACKYINESYSKYNSWTLAAASYNVGRTGIDRQIERQKTKEYYDILFNEETARYLFRILSLKMVIENPLAFNFYVPQEKLYLPIPYKEVEINTPIESWAIFALEHKTNYKLLKYLNPWLRDDKLTNKSLKTYVIKVPTKGSRLLE
jgi:membrane-bound lytic murein transglycosylase D